MNAKNIAKYGMLISSCLVGGMSVANAQLPANVVGIAGGDWYSLALKSDGTVWSWGDNLYGELGDGAGGTNGSNPTPRQVGSLTNIVNVSAGYVHGLAVQNDGSLWAWGTNWYGALGDGTTQTRYSPVLITSISDVVSVSGGAFHSLAVKSDGTVWSWGYNADGELGNGTTTTALAPVQVSGLYNVVAVSAGGNCSVALKSDGTVWAWGSNNRGQLGDGTTTDRLPPTQVSGISNAVAITSSNATGTNYALLADGSVVAWGANDSGQIGDGTTIDRSYPTAVSGLSGVVAFDAGGEYCIAVKSDGTVWGWGNNIGPGVIGYYGANSYLTPVQVTGYSTASFVAAGYLHTLVVDSNGDVTAYGGNSQGQLGY
jgi:alpha-tubulin suppressor-like RCC1 family protein